MSEENFHALVYNVGSHVEQTCEDDELARIWFTYCHSSSQQNPYRGTGVRISVAAIRLLMVHCSQACSDEYGFLGMKPCFHCDALPYIVHMLTNYGLLICLTVLNLSLCSLRAQIMRTSFWKLIIRDFANAYFSLVSFTSNNEGCCRANPTLINPAYRTNELRNSWLRYSLFSSSECPLSNLTNILSVWMLSNNTQIMKYVHKKEGSLIAP